MSTTFPCTHPALSSSTTVRYDPEIHQRRSIRLRNHDYSQSGMYFVTLCTHRRIPLFGVVTRGQMTLSSCGDIVLTEWERSAKLRTDVELART